MPKVVQTELTELANAVHELVDCGRQNCHLTYPDNAERWCRACLLRVVEREQQMRRRRGHAGELGYDY